VALAALLAPGAAGAGGGSAAPALAAAAMAGTGGSSARDTRDVLQLVGGGGSVRLSDVRWSHATNSVAKLAEVWPRSRAPRRALPGRRRR